MTMDNTIMKKARSSYILYTIDTAVRSKVKKDNPDAKLGEISKILGKQWKSLSDKEKKKYTDASAKEKAEVDKLKKTNPELFVKKEKKAKKEKKVVDKNKPKRPLNAYMIYAQDARVELKKKNPEMKAVGGEISKKIGEQWKKLAAKDKKKYEDLAKKAKSEYEKKMKDYVPPPTVVVDEKVQKEEPKKVKKAKK